MAKQNFEQFFNELTELEKSTGAFKARFGGVQLYALLRVRIFYLIATGLGLFDNPHPAKANNKDAVAGAKLAGLEQTPVVVLPFKRQVGSTDPYSDRIVELLRTGAELPEGGKLEGSALPLRVLHHEGGAGAMEPTVESIRAYGSKKYFNQMRLALKLKPISSLSAKRWARLIDALESKFGISLDAIKKYPPNALRLAFTDQRAFADYFKAVGAKHLYIVDAYSNGSIVLGAKRAGVKVHEIQHGFVTKYHPAYSFSSAGVKIDRAPDTLLVWGKYWGEELALPQGTEVVVTGPTTSFSDYRAEVEKHNRKVMNQVLFTSQGAVATQLLTAALHTANERPDLNVIYRLHPNENLDDYQALAGTLGAKQLPKNFSFSHKDPIFLDLVSQSEYLVGAFSTTLYEGLALGCKVLVLALPGYEHVQRAIALGDMTLVDTLEELPNYLSQAKATQDARRYYA